MIVVTNRIPVAKGHEEEFERRFAFKSWTESAEFRETSFAPG